MAICNPLPKEFRGGIVFLYSALWLVKKSLTPCLNQSDAKLWGRGRLALPRRREPPFVKHAYRVLISLIWFYSTGTCDFVTQGCSSQCLFNNPQPKSSLWYRSSFAVLEFLCLNFWFQSLTHRLVPFYRLALHPRKQVLATVSDDWSWKMWGVPRWTAFSGIINFVIFLSSKMEFCEQCSLKVQSQWYCAENKRILNRVANASTRRKPIHFYVNALATAFANNCLRMRKTSIHRRMKLV